MFLLFILIAGVALILSIVVAFGAGMGAPVALIISLISLGLSILALHRTGMTFDLKNKIESSEPPEDLKKQVDAVMAMTDALREKTADALDRLEKVIRKTEKAD
ncbi:MAG: hypothetical protein A2V86_14040 [Deltaproteobacteria bacterium RBG_16_49_23]|nr:MAG: hypothetical protein A2V86_14040 [Deltaproteobacteria bacterium RBG_16_49_23]